MRAVELAYLYGEWALLGLSLCPRWRLTPGHITHHHLRHVDEDLSARPLDTASSSIEQPGVKALH